MVLFMSKLTSKQKGIVCILLAAFCFATMNLFVKLSGDVPTFQKAFFRNLVAAGIAFVMLLKSGDKVRIGRQNYLFLLIRVTAGTLGILANFYAISQMNIADASMLNKLSPFFAIIFSIWILKEKPSQRDLIAVVMAFIGALFVIKPTFGFDSMPAVIASLGGMGAGLAYTCVRRLKMQGMASAVIVLLFSLFSCLVCVPSMVISPAPMTTAQLLFLIGAGIAGAGGQFSITAAYSFAPAKEISVFDYTQVIFAALLSLLFVGEFPDIFSIIGYVIIIGIAIWKAKQ